MHAFRPDEAREADLVAICVAALGEAPRCYELSHGAFEAMRDRLEVLQLWRALTSARWMLGTGRGRPTVVRSLAARARSLLPLASA